MEEGNLPLYSCAYIPFCTLGQLSGQIQMGLHLVTSISPKIAISYVVKADCQIITWEQCADDLKEFMLRFVVLFYSNVHCRKQKGNPSKSFASIYRGNMKYERWCISWDIRQMIKSRWEIGIRLLSGAVFLCLQSLQAEQDRSENSPLGNEHPKSRPTFLGACSLLLVLKYLGTYKLPLYLHWWANRLGLNIWTSVAMVRRVSCGKWVQSRVKVRMVLVRFSNSLPGIGRWLPKGKLGWY